MLDLEVADATAHISDDVVFLSIFAEGLGEEVIGLVDDMERRVVRSFETSLVDGDQTVPPLEEVVAVFGLGWSIIDGSKSPISLSIAEFVDL